MDGDIFTQEIISQWREIWKGQNLVEVVERNLKDNVLLPIFLKYLPKDQKILEAGCGIGGWLVVLKKLGYDIIGVDIVEECINLCKSKFPEIDIRIADVRNLDFPDEFFGGYISLGVIEHMIEGPYSVIKEANRVLKKNGIAIFTVPAFNYFLRLFFPLRKIFVEIFRESNYLRKIFKRSIIVDKKEYKRKLYFIKNKLIKNLWPVISIENGLPSFSEYRYPLGYLDEIFKECGFKLIFFKPIFYPVVFYSTFGKLFVKNGQPYELNFLGQILKHFFDFLGPNFFNAYLLYVVKKIE